MLIEEIATKLRAKYPSRKLLALAFNRYGVTGAFQEKTATALFELDDDSSAVYATWFVNFYDENNVYTISGNYFHEADAPDWRGLLSKAMDDFKARILA